MMGERKLLTIEVGEDKNKKTNIPFYFSTLPDDLYRACSPKQPWHSSLTFEHGKPVQHDVHGAEETLYGYIRLGTAVAFIPRAKNLTTPWDARMFLHTTEKEDAYVPQPSYSHDRILSILLEDAVDFYLFNVHGMVSREIRRCEDKYEGVYIDIALDMPITREDIDIIKERWNGFTMYYGDHH